MVEILNDPHIKAAVQLEGHKDRLVADLAEQIMSAKNWQHMTKDERKTCIRYIVSQVSSEEELRARLQSDFALGHVAINWHLSDAGDKTGDEARMLVKALGGLVAKNGALVMIMTSDGMF